MLVWVIASNFDEFIVGAGASRSFKLELLLIMVTLPEIVYCVFCEPFCVCVGMVLGDHQGRPDGLLCYEVERGWRGGGLLAGRGTQFEKGKEGRREDGTAR